MFFLLYWTGKHNKVASEMSWIDLVSKATAVILSLNVTPEFPQRFGDTLEEFAGLNPKPKTWVELTVLKVVADEDLVEIHLPEAQSAIEEVENIIRETREDFIP